MRKTHVPSAAVMCLFGAFLASEVGGSVACSSAPIQGSSGETPEDPTDEPDSPRRDAGPPTASSGGGGGTAGNVDAGTTPATPAKLALMATRVGSGADYACALTTAGVVKCWYRNDRGQLGLGNTQGRGALGAHPGADLGTGKKAVAISVGWYHGCALLDDGAVKCWGQNDAGQLGQGDTKNRGDNGGEMGNALPGIALGAGERKVVQITSGGYHNCALFEDGAVKCWGANGFGQLGLGDQQARGDAAGELGDALPFVDLGARRAVLLSAGNFHTCAVLDDGSARCWGNGGDGQTGLGVRGNQGAGKGQMGAALPAVNLGAGRTAKWITAGGFHSCAVLDDNSVKCWGANDQGQLGLGDKGTRGATAATMGDALPAVQLGQGAKSVAAVYDHTCAVMLDGSLKCWGWNNQGQLGLGDKNARGDTGGEMGAALPTVPMGNGRTVLQLAPGWDHSCALLDNASVKCWGLNALGDGQTRGDNGDEMGEKLPALAL